MNNDKEAVDANQPLGGEGSEPWAEPREAAEPRSGGSAILLTEDQIRELQAKAAKADENWDRLLRMSAEFDNFKKRAARDRQDAVKYANESILEKLIPALDNFEMALAAAQGGDGGSLEALKTGINMVYLHLRSTLTDAGLEILDASQGVFDPNWQEAVSQQDSLEIPEGHIVQQLRKGYRFKERLLRPAKVIVAKRPTSG